MGSLGINFFPGIGFVQKCTQKTIDLCPTNIGLLVIVTTFGEYSDTTR